MPPTTRIAGQETFRCGSEITGLTLYTLHAGDARAATWHEDPLPPEVTSDHQGGIVWLLGVRDEHDYEGLCALGGDLLPSEDDYEAFIGDESYDFARMLVEEVPPLLAMAESNRGRVVEGLLGNAIRVRLFHDRESDAPLLTVAISSRPLPNGVALVPLWQTRLMLAFFDAQDFDALSVTTDIGGMPLEPDESAYCSFRG